MTRMRTASHQIYLDRKRNAQIRLANRNEQGKSSELCKILGRKGNTGVKKSTPKQASGKKARSNETHRAAGNELTLCLP